MLFTKALKELKESELTWSQLVFIFKKYNWKIFVFPVIIFSVVFFSTTLISPRWEVILTLKMGAINRLPTDNAMDINKKILESVGNLADQVNNPNFYEKDLRPLISFPPGFFFQNDTLTTELNAPEEIYIKAKTESKELGIEMVNTVLQIIIEDHVPIFIGRLEGETGPWETKKFYMTNQTGELKISRVIKPHKIVILLVSVTVVALLLSILFAHIHQRLLE